MQNKNHILLLPSWYPSNATDIRGCFFREQALALVNAGYQVGVVTTELRSLKNWKSIFSLNHGCFYEHDKGINTFRFKTMYWFPKVPLLIGYLSLLGGKIAIEQYINKFGKPDLIHVHSCLYMGQLAQYIKNKYNINYVVTEHSSGYFRNIYNKNQLEITKSILDDSQAVIAVSKKMAQYFSKNIFNEKQWNIIPNIVDSEFLKTKLTNKKENKFRFINIAFMNENKRQLNLLKAFEKLIKNGNNDIELIMVGEGSEKKNLEKYVYEEKIEGVKFLGKKSRKEIATIMSKCDCFVLSSKFETFGVVLIEALALGLPVVSTMCGGPEDIVNSHNGLLVEPDNIDDLAFAMKKIMENMDSYEKEVIRKKCEKDYGEKSIINKLTAIYEQ